MDYRFFNVILMAAEITTYFMIVVFIWLGFFNTKEGIHLYGYMASLKDSL